MCLDKTLTKWDLKLGVLLNIGVLSNQVCYWYLLWSSFEVSKTIWFDEVSDVSNVDSQLPMTIRQSSENNFVREHNQ